MDEIRMASSLDHPQSWLSIHQYMRYLEIETPLPDYMEKVQNQLTPIIREHVVNLLVKVADWYELLSETLHLCISYIDRFLSSRAVPKNKLMILGVVDMEMEVLSVLNFKMCSPTTRAVLTIFAKAASEEDGDALLLPFVYLCDYLGDLSLMDYSCLRFLPSMVAASAVFLARFIMWTNLHPWVSTDTTSRRNMP